MAGSHESKARPGRSQFQGHTASDFPRFSQDTRRRSSRVCPWEASQRDGTVQTTTSMHLCMHAHCPVLFYIRHSRVALFGDSIDNGSGSPSPSGPRPECPSYVLMQAAWPADQPARFRETNRGGVQAKAKQSKPSFERDTGLGEMVSGGLTRGPWWSPGDAFACVCACFCVLRLCFQPYTAPLSYSPRACSRLQVEMFVMRPSLLLGPCRASFVSLAGWLRAAAVVSIDSPIV